jgi:hypothetical protein
MKILHDVAVFKQQKLFKIVTTDHNHSEEIFLHFEYIKNKTCLNSRKREVLSELSSSTEKMDKSFQV